MRLLIKTGEHEFPPDSHTLRDRLRSSVTWEGHRVESLLLCIPAGDLVKMPSGHFPREVAPLGLRAEP